MKELQTVSRELKQRFNTDTIAGINEISDILINDMMRYDRIIDAKEETDEH